MTNDGGCTLSRENSTVDDASTDLFSSTKVRRRGGKRNPVYFFLLASLGFGLLQTMLVARKGESILQTVHYDDRPSIQEERNLSHGTSSAKISKHGSSRSRSDECDHSNREELADGAAACLLIKDDNDRLPEWLAYHYHVLPLRHLVVAVDPTSLTSPVDILKRWNTTADSSPCSDSNATEGMEIVVWHEDDYQPLSLEKLGPAAVHYYMVTSNAKFSPGRAHQMATADAITRHQMRQRMFIRECMEFHKRRNRTWTIHIDSDEYVIFNRISKKGDPLSDQKAADKVKQDYVNSVEKNTTEARDVMLMTRFDLPSITNTTIMRYLDGLKDQFPWKDISCLQMPRLLFSTHGSTSDEISKNVPNGIDPTKLDTLRYRKHAGYGDFKFSRFGKSFADLSRLPEADLANIPHTIHKLFPSCYGNAFPRHDESILRVHHYLGSEESYFKRKDPRRTKEKYLEKNPPLRRSLDDDDIRPWVTSFADDVGIEKAAHLLDGAAVVRTHNGTN